MPLNKRNRLANVADAVLDSVSIVTTHRQTLGNTSVIFCSIFEVIKKYQDLVRKYLGNVVPSKDNYYAALNSAVLNDGSFVTYQRILSAQCIFSHILGLMPWKRDSLREL